MATTNGKKELGLARPDPYDGDRTKIDKFIQDCQLYLLINEEVYNDDKKKIGFFLSLMSKGEAAEWKEQYIKSLLDANNKIVLPDLLTFSTRIRNDFKQEDRVGGAMAKLRRLRQGKDQSVEGLVSEFRLLVGQAGLGSTTDSDQLHLIELFKEALNPRIAAKILFSDTIPTTIANWYK